MRVGILGSGLMGRKLLGFDPVDASPLRMARYAEPFAFVVARFAYQGDGGLELAYRLERFRK